MHACPPTQSRLRGFTLIELLVVITITAVLVAILFPVFGSVTDASKRSQVVNDEKNIITAVYSYQADNNNRLPLTDDQAKGRQYGYDTVYGDPGHARYPNYLLFDILRGQQDDQITDNHYNPSGTSYFQEPYVKDPNNPRNGILPKDFFDGNYTVKKGAFVDPWGGEYMVFMDANLDGDLNLAISYLYPTWPKTPDYGPHGSVAVVSVGPDGDIGRKSNQILPGSDDIPSFQ